MFEAAGLGQLIVRELGLGDPDVEPDLDSWRALVDRIKAPKPILEIALVGKYIELPDAYLSVTEALRHAAWAHEVDAKVRWVDSEALTHENLHDRLDGVAGILVPGGFGHRGIEGKVLAAHFAREHRIPYLGLCLGPPVRRHRVRPRGRRDRATPTRPSSTCSPSTRSSTSCPTSATWRTRAARCGSASTRPS